MRNPLHLISKNPVKLVAFIKKAGGRFGAGVPLDRRRLVVWVYPAIFPYFFLMGFYLLLISCSEPVEYLYKFEVRCVFNDGSIDTVRFDYKERFGFE